MALRARRVLTARFCCVSISVMLRQAYDIHARDAKDADEVCLIVSRLRCFVAVRRWTAMLSSFFHGGVVFKALHLFQKYRAAEAGAGKGDGKSAAGTAAESKNGKAAPTLHSPSPCHVRLNLGDVVHAIGLGHAKFPVRIRLPRCCVHRRLS